MSYNHICRVISSKQVLSESHFKHFMFQLLCGVKFLHSNRVIHRDLKPANLLVTKDCKLRITDFGLARESTRGKQRIETEAYADDPMTEHVVTRWYRACELMLLPDGLYSYAVDMWACGCILGEMLLRKPLFPGKNFVNQLTLIFDLIGCPPSEETGHIRNSQARKFLESQSAKKKKNFHTVFPEASVDALHLLDGLLLFDPTKRMDVEQALESSFVVDAGGHSRQLCLTFPQVDSRFEFGFERQNNSVADLRELIIREIESFKEETVLITTSATALEESNQKFKSSPKKSPQRTASRRALSSQHLGSECADNAAAAAQEPALKSNDSRPLHMSQKFEDPMVTSQAMQSLLSPRRELNRNLDGSRQQSLIMSPTKGVELRDKATSESGVHRSAKECVTARLESAIKAESRGESSQTEHVESKGVARTSSSHTGSNGKAAGLTVPKGPNFSVMSWQRKHSSDESESGSTATGSRSHHSSGLDNLLRPTASSASKTPSNSVARAHSNPRARPERKRNNGSLS